MSVNKAHQLSDLKAYRLYANTKPKDLVPPITYTNNTTSGLYKPPTWPVRNGQDDNLQHASIGLSAQVTRS